MTYLPPHISLLLTGLCQIIGFTAGLALRQFWLPPALYLGGHAAASFAAARLLKLPAAWRILNALLPLSLPLLLTARFSPSFWLVLLLAFLFFAPTFWTKVPFYPTSRGMYSEVARLLPQQRPFTFLDAGCGFGSMLFDLARRFPDARFQGVELSPLPFLAAKIRSWFYPNVTINFENFWTRSFGGLDFVYVFLAPPPMPRIWEKAQKEMRGAVLLSSSFPAPAEASQVKRFGEKNNKEEVLYVYRMEARR